MFSDFKKFISKYAGELTGITTAIGAITNTLPIGKQDKAKIAGILEGLETASASILKSVGKMKEPAKVTIKKSDIEEVVREVLPDIVRGLVIEELAKATPPAEAPASE